MASLVEHLDRFSKVIFRLLDQTTIFHQKGFKKMYNNANAEQLMEKWAPVLEHGEGIQDAHKRAVTAQLLENQAVALQGRACFPLRELQSQLSPTQLQVQVHLMALVSLAYSGARSLLLVSIPY